jgi:hypothetical protein
MDGDLDRYLSAAMLLGGLAAIAGAAWIDHRRAAHPMPALVPMGPIMLLGTLLVLWAIVYFLNTLRSGDSSYYIAAAVLLYGSVVGGITVLVEHRRRQNPKPRLASTTPFLLLAAILVLVSIVLFYAVLRDDTPAPSWRPRRLSLADYLIWPAWTIVDRRKAAQWPPS